MSDREISVGIGVYGVAFTDDRGQVLLTHRQGYEVWELPGGDAEPGEALRAALARVFQAGLGLAASAGEAMYFSERSEEREDEGAGPGRQAIRLFFLTHTGGTLDPRYAERIDSGGAKQGAAWVPVDELDALAIGGDDYDAIQRALQWLELSEGPSLASADEDDE